MAYCRWLEGDWYIFWHSSSAVKKQEELLAVWNVLDDTLPTFKYTEIKQFLKKPETMVGKIPEYTPMYENYLLDIFKNFIADVDEIYANKGKK